MSDVVKVNVNVHQIGPTASEGKAREHTVVMDRPEAKGGKNRGAMGGENLLMALGGCFMSNLLAAAQARESDLKDVRLHITGSLVSAPPSFTAVDMQISADYSDKAEMEKLVTIAERGCIVAYTLKNAVDLTIALSSTVP
jgi:putative redox protein